MTSSRRAASAAALALALLASACSGGGDPGPEDAPPRPGGLEAPPEIAALWTAPGGQGGIDVVAHDDRYVVQRLGGRGLRGLDLATGEEVWSRRTPGDLRRWCHVSPQVTDGVAGVLLGAGAGRDCTVAGALEVATGELRWTREIPGEPPFHEGRGVDVGDRTLLAEMSCSEVVRLSLTDGTPRETLAPRDRKCAMEADTDGAVVAVLDDPETAETPDDGGTGFVPPSDAAGALELYDADSGDRLWRRPLPSTSGRGVGAVVSSDPLILTTDEDGHRTTRFFDDRGRPGGYVGKTLQALGAEESLPVVGRVDGVLVARYAEADETTLVGYDEETGTELWTRLLEPAATAAVTDDAVVVTQSVVASEGATLWVTRQDPRDADDVVTLGRAPGFQGVVVGDLLLTDGDDGGGDGLVAYPLDGEGEERTYTPRFGPEPRWAEGEVRPEDAVDACEAVSDPTLALAGLDWSDLPAPADCSWQERYDPEYLNRSVTAAVRTYEPDPASEEDASASAAAVAATVPLVAQGAGGLTGPGRALEPLDDGPGDRAWAGTGTEGYAVSARSVTQWRNVVVDVTVTQEIELRDRLPSAVPVGQLVQAARAATYDVLAGLGDDETAPSPGADGPVSRVARACRTLAPVGARLVPDAEPYGDLVDAADPGRRSACTWSGENELVVEAWAAPGSPDGQDARAWALELGALLARAPLGREPGLPGRSAVSRYDDGDYRSAEAVVVVDNLLVQVDYTDPESATRDDVDAAVTEVVRQLVRAAR